jgi:hypothetical protein
MDNRNYVAPASKYTPEFAAALPAELRRVLEWELPAEDQEREQAAAAVLKAGYIRLSLRSTAEPIYTRFPFIFSSSFSNVTIGCNPRRRRSSSVLCARGPGARLGVWQTDSV